MTIKWIKVDGGQDGPIDVRYGVHHPKLKGKKGVRGRVIILPGLTEFIEKHQDQTDGFSALGFETVCIDWPGQGLSTRLAGGYPHAIQISDYQVHLDAITAVMTAEGIMDDAETPLFIFGHSMGGHLALRLARVMQDEAAINVRGVMLSAPMIMIPVTLRRLSLNILEGLCKMGLARKPVPGQQGFSRSGGGFNPLNVLTRDPDGYAVQHKLFEQNPELRSHGPTFGWVKATLASCIATTTNPQWMAGMKLPVQAHLAGNELVTHRFESAPNLAHIKGAEVHIYDDARHELMLELPEVRAAIWDRMAQFIDDHISRDDG